MLYVPPASLEDLGLWVLGFSEFSAVCRSLQACVFFGVLMVSFAVCWRIFSAPLVVGLLFQFLPSTLSPEPYTLNLASPQPRTLNSKAL